MRKARARAQIPFSMRSFNFSVNRHAVGLGIKLNLVTVLARKTHRNLHQAHFALILSDAALTSIHAERG
jgi:hypothetical protein